MLVAVVKLLIFLLLVACCGIRTDFFCFFVFIPCPSPSDGRARRGPDVFLKGVDRLCVSSPCTQERGTGPGGAGDWHRAVVVISVRQLKKLE